MNRYNDWLQTVLCWDGRFTVGGVLHFRGWCNSFFPADKVSCEITALVVPHLCVFHPWHPWIQTISKRSVPTLAGSLFIVAILLLALCDTVFILFTTLPNIALESDWHVLWMIYWPI